MGCDTRLHVEPTKISMFHPKNRPAVQKHVCIKCIGAFPHKHQLSQMPGPRQLGCKSAFEKATYLYEWVSVIITKINDILKQFKKVIFKVFNKMLHSVKSLELVYENMYTYIVTRFPLDRTF